MERKATNPQDRRTKYTRGVIKDSLLELMVRRPFAKITVTELCQRAEINRGTFYLHYYDMDDVLDDLLTDAFADTTGVLDHVLCPRRPSCTYPLCEKVQGNPAYRPLFMDDGVAPRIIEKISDSCKESFVTSLMQRSQLTFQQAEAIFCFQINGCLTINRMMLQNHCTDWRTIQSTIDRFLRSGLEEFLEENR
ncbi:MAG: TetR/AcrR family transcriptional regulator [Eubacteriales bacterium]|nr:TetR/AcrR family transcriptional regulator [Eubacteriales bacterium]